MFSLFGMALGVAALIIVLSVMNGFNKEIQLRFQTVSPHISFLSNNDSLQFSDSPVSEAASLQDVLDNHDAVQGWAPLVSGYGLLSTAYAQAPAVLNGISPEADQNVVPLDQHMLYGSLDGLQTGQYGLVLGSYLARQLYVRVGDPVQLVLPEVQVTPTGLYPRQKQFFVVGIFDSGSQLDAELAYVHIDDAARLLRLSSQGTGFRVRLDSADLTVPFMEEFKKSALASQWRVQTWSSNYQSLFNAMKMEKVTVGLLLLIIVMVAAFNIVSGLVMMVSDKRADMAVVRTLGASSGTVMRVFVAQGVILGVGGILIGAAIGTLVTFNLSSIVSFFFSWFVFFFVDLVVSYPMEIL